MNIVCRKCWGGLGCGALFAFMLSACGTAPTTPLPTTPPPTPVVPRSSQIVEEASLVQALQRQLREREKRIGELESQLNILKMIDQDVQVRRKPVRIPATLTPTE